MYNNSYHRINGTLQSTSIEVSLQKMLYPDYSEEKLIQAAIQESLELAHNSEQANKPKMNQQNTQSRDNTNNNELELVRSLQEIRLA